VIRKLQRRSIELLEQRGGKAYKSSGKWHVYGDGTVSVTMPNGKHVDVCPNGRVRGANKDTRWDYNICDDCLLPKPVEDFTLVYGRMIEGSCKKCQRRDSARAKVLDRLLTKRG
jgi:hypothetical protein